MLCPPVYTIEAFNKWSYDYSVTGTPSGIHRIRYPSGLTEADHLEEALWEVISESLQEGVMTDESTVVYVLERMKCRLIHDGIEKTEEDV